METYKEKPSLYHRFDDKLMQGVNAGVRAWNYTTGRTKADLAMAVTTASYLQLPIIEAVNVISKGEKFDWYTIPLTLLCGVINLSVAARIKHIGESERNVLNSDPKDLDFEHNKKDLDNNRHDLEVMANNFFALSPMSFLASRSLPLTLYCFGAGVGEHIMRADYLPARKDCVRRGLDKLTGKSSNTVREEVVSASNSTNVIVDNSNAVNTRQVQESVSYKEI